MEVRAMEHVFPLMVVAAGILFLLILITRLQINTFISLIITAFVVALALGMPLNSKCYVVMINVKDRHIMYKLFQKHDLPM